MNKAIVITEDQLRELNSDEVYVDPYEPKDELNKHFWIDGKLNSKIRLRLLDIADDFYDSLNIKWVKPVDIVLTGSIANYNWTIYSDIDVHIIVDYEDIFEKKDFVKSYFDSKKEVWGLEHENLKILGFPVELYVEDLNSPAVSSGVYSLETNEWVKEPKDMKDEELNQEYIQHMVAKYATKIEKLEKKIEDEDDKVKINELTEKLEKIFDRLKDVRKEGLESDEQELSSGNIIWKILRNEGYIEKIWNIINYNYDVNNSITESMSKAEINREANKADKHPTDAQKKSGNYKLGHINVLGFDISIENPKGSYRYWTDEKGNKGKNKMNNHYGYFKRSSGHDGDQVDVFIGNNIKSEKIYVIDQNNNSGDFDESKVMLGFDNAKDAKAAYMSNYDKDWKGFRGISCVDKEEFRKWLYDGRKQQKPFAEYKNIKKLDESFNKEQQLIILNKYNPMLDDYHTGIRTIDDIKTFEEAVEWATDEYYNEYGAYATYPDITNEIVEEALKTHKINIYSSKPIRPGTFVTPSILQAEEYSGGGYYHKYVDTSDVAWIDVDEGEYTGHDRRTFKKASMNVINEKKEKEDPFFKKHGIKEISCGFGFSEQEQKYYGWSHRAIYGFGIGSKVKKGDCGFDGKNKKEAGFENKQWVAKTMEDAKKMALDFKEAVD